MKLVLYNSTSARPTYRSVAQSLIIWAIPKRKDHIERIPNIQIYISFWKSWILSFLRIRSNFFQAQPKFTTTFLFIGGYLNMKLFIFCHIYGQFVYLRLLSWILLVFHIYIIKTICFPPNTFLFGTHEAVTSGSSKLKKFLSNL